MPFLRPAKLPFTSLERWELIDVWSVAFFEGFVKRLHIAVIGSLPVLPTNLDSTVADSVADNARCHHRVWHTFISARGAELADFPSISGYRRDLDLPGTPVVANGVVYVMASGDRATDAIRGPRGGRGGPGGPGGRGGGRGVTLSEVNPNQPGYEHDATWRALQLRPVEEGGQQSGARNSGGSDTTHGVLYALDAATGAELFTSGEAIDSWNHDGNIALSGGTLYLSTYHGSLCFWTEEVAVRGSPRRVLR